MNHLTNQMRAIFGNNRKTSRVYTGVMIRIVSVTLWLAFGFLTSPAPAQVSVDRVLASANRLPAPERTARLVEGARKERLIEWYGTIPFNQARELINPFRKRYPFIELKYTRGGSSSLFNRVVTEQKAGIRKADVLGFASSLHATLMQAGLVAKNMAPFRMYLRPGFKDTDGYLSSPFTYAVVIGYNTEFVAPKKVPRAYENLLRPEWKGQITIDREAYNWLAGLLDIFGEEKGLDFARKLAALDPVLHRGHTLMTQLMAAGSVKLMAEGYHYRIQEFKEKGAPVDYVLTDPTMLKDPSSIWIVKQAPHPHAAALLVDFLFSREGQKVYARQNRLVAHKRIKWDFKDKKLRRFHMISPEKWGPRYNELVKMFDKIFRQRGQ